jgi:hypothetical protein
LKIAFPILRMNWYRVAATTIEAALRAGHEVECWHFVGGNHYAANRPNAARVPAFRHGAPTILEYCRDAEFLDFICRRRPDAVASVSVPWPGIVGPLSALSARPVWATLTTNDTFSFTFDMETLRLCDVIALRSAHERECILRDHTRDVADVVRRMAGEPRTHGRMFPDLLAKRAARQWTDDMCAHFRARSVVTGYPMLDSIAGLDRAAIRRKWGIADGRPVVSCLASPYGSVLDADWERAFATTSPLRRRWWNFRRLGLRGLANPPPNEAEVMSAIADFARQNGAFNITKMRHSQDASPAIRAASDLVLGEESYHPHTAIEMSAVSDVVFGFFTTGAPEAVAAGARFIEIRIPGYNRYVWECASSQFLRMFDRPGASWSLSAEEWIATARDKRLADFEPDARVRTAYFADYCGPMDGRHAERLVRAIERVHEGSLPAEWPVDAGGAMIP